LPKLPVVNARELLAALRRAGFVERRQTGSHVILRHPDGRFATVPKHPGDLGTGLLAAILRQAEISAEDFGKLL